MRQSTTQIQREPYANDGPHAADGPIVLGTASIAGKPVPHRVRLPADRAMMPRNSRTMRRVVAIGVLAVVALGGGVWMWRRGGPIHDPRSLEFQASPDHYAVDKKGVPLVQHYVLELYVGDSSVPAQRIDLGKPSPAADGVIHIDLSSIRMLPPPQGTTYEAAITAVGPYGSGASSRSNRFTLSR